MSKWDKLIMRICNLSKDLDLMSYGKYWKVTDIKMDAPRSGKQSFILSEKQGL